MVNRQNIKVNLKSKNYKHIDKYSACMDNCSEVK